MNDLLGKTDDDIDSGEMGFNFYDQNMDLIVGDNEIGRNSAFFTYDAAANDDKTIAYYSVKGGNEGFNVYLFSPGELNPMSTPTGQAISHSSFWLGAAIQTSGLPEPSACIVWGLLGLTLAGGYRFQQRKR